MSRSRSAPPSSDSSYIAVSLPSRADSKKHKSGPGPFTPKVVKQILKKQEEQSVRITDCATENDELLFVRALTMVVTDKQWKEARAALSEQAIQYEVFLAATIPSSSSSAPL